MKKLILAAVLALMPTAVLADENKLIRVMNYSNTQYITSVTVTNEHGRTYQALRSPITPGYNMVLSFDDGEGHNHCNVTIVAKFANGVTAQRQANICSIDQWRIFDIDNVVDDF